MALPTRKTQTKNPSPLPEEFLRAVRELFQKQFKKNLEGAEFLIYADLYPEEVIFCVSLTHPKSLRAASLYLSADLAEGLAESPEKVTEQLKTLVDVGASWFSQAFTESEGLEAAMALVDASSGAWDNFPWEGQTLYAKLNRDNHALEHVADQLLRESGMDTDEDISDEELEDLLNEDDDEGPKFH